MKIKNNNLYSIMYGLDDFIKAGEVKEIADDMAIKLLKHPNVEEYVSKKQVTDLEDENKKLKEEILAQLKAEADSLGIKYSPKIGIEKLKAKIAEAK